MEYFVNVFNWMKSAWKQNQLPKTIRSDWFWILMFAIIVYSQQVFDMSQIFEAQRQPKLTGK